MLGLINYEDSDEEDEVAKDETLNIQPDSEASRPTDHGKRKATEPEEPTIAPLEKISRDTAPPSGPALGPSMPINHLEATSNGSNSRAASPYSSNRLSIRNLTMPPVPNFEIPPSPPGSPPPTSTKKFAKFLELKKQGIHFNEKLEKSSALRNPSLLQKLMDFAGFEEGDQYKTALPDELALPTSFPAWAYADQLNKTQQKVLKKREEERAKKLREGNGVIEFAPAGSGSTSRAATPGAARNAPVSAAERIMAGLDKEKSRSPAVQSDGRRRDGERNNGRPEVRKNRFRSRSRSPKRKRSRSR
ncbi:hypothetical protein EJ08DRAFT_604881 [Tothia fuscella]|uniref:HCNGP-domain-containing protein n=1 Tax=Tothia fuscella TaxID=1048955 RepID=A0A9P4U310_9PEZI|nr:hypothetical protein EJ08DRAFT_604881 [Tothia fuscella]